MVWGLKIEDYEAAILSKCTSLLSANLELWADLLYSNQVNSLYKLSSPFIREGKGAIFSLNGGPPKYIIEILDFKLFVNTLCFTLLNLPLVITFTNTITKKSFNFSFSLLVYVYMNKKFNLFKPFCFFQYTKPKSFYDGNYHWRKFQKTHLWNRVFFKKTQMGRNEFSFYFFLLVSKTKRKPIRVGWGDLSKQEASWQT